MAKWFGLVAIIAMGWTGIYGAAAFPHYASLWAFVANVAGVLLGACLVEPTRAR